MTELSYFALVGIEPLTLQELLTCRAQRLGLSPPNWPDPTEPEPPPPLGSAILPNLDMTKLTDSVQIFDIHYLTPPDIGGAWQVKWNLNLEQKEDLIVACMHDSSSKVL
jgi:hypothetical protein